ncbi:ester cyclase [Anatilimnocola sp. NA78]|uniref:ester cyclase n=1 Tax=Anatilimnocola sp. NA78 TaxID=3415683 RepID=UPI003CE4BC6A
MSAENVAMARRWFEEVWNQRREATIDEFLTADSVCYGDDGPIIGPEEFRQRQFIPFLAAFPDLQVQVDDALGSGDQVVVRWTARGGHHGHGLGCAPTGRTVVMQGITWIRVANGKLAEGWQCSNIPQVFQGLMHPPA